MTSNKYDLRFYIVDTETTGLDPNEHEITEISVIRYSDRKQLSLKVRPKYPYRASEDALKITNKTIYDLIATGEEPEAALGKVKTFLADGNPDPSKVVLVAHNGLRFDKFFIQKLYESNNEKMEPSLWFDTLIGSKLVLNERSNVYTSFCQAECLRHFGIKDYPGDIHSAETDSRNCYFLFKHLLEVEKVDLKKVIKRCLHNHTPKGKHV